MKAILPILLSGIIMLSAYSTFSQSSQTAINRYTPPPYKPDDIKLYNTIARLDSIYFDAYNTSKLEVIDSLTSENLEFYHDHGGLSTSKSETLAAIKRNIFGRVTRRLTPGSLEVYTIPNYGAVEFGYHSFCNIAEPNESHPSKFVVIWQHKGDKWQMTRVISLH